MLNFYDKTLYFTLVKISTHTVCQHIKFILHYI